MKLDTLASLYTESGRLLITDPAYLVDRTIMESLIELSCRNPLAGLEAEVAEMRAFSDYATGLIKLSESLLAGGEHEGLQEKMQDLSETRDRRLAEINVEVPDYLLPNFIQNENSVVFINPIGTTYTPVMLTSTHLMVPFNFTFTNDEPPRPDTSEFEGECIGFTKGETKNLTVVDPSNFEVLDMVDPSLYVVAKVKPGNYSLRFIENNSEVLIEPEP